MRYIIIITKAQKGVCSGAQSKSQSFDKAKSPKGFRLYTFGYFFLYKNQNLMPSETDVAPKPISGRIGIG